MPMLFVTSADEYTVLSYRPSVADPTALSAARKNLLINGDFSVWQRGVNFTNLTGYTADRWTVATASDATVTRSQELPPGAMAHFSLKIVRPLLTVWFNGCAK